MKWTKPSPGLIAELKAVREQLPLAQPRKMFGYDALFVNGNMAVGLWQNTCVVKLAPRDQSELLARGLAVPFCPMPNRPMGGWLELSEEVAHDPEQLLEWSRRAVNFIATLPPKAGKGRAAQERPKQASKRTTEQRAKISHPSSPMPAKKVRRQPKAGLRAPSTAKRKG